MRVALFASDGFGGYVFDTVREAADVDLVCVVGDTVSTRGRLERKLRAIARRPSRALRTIRKALHKDLDPPPPPSMRAASQQKHPGLAELCARHDIPFHEDYELAAGAFARHLHSLDLDLIFVATFGALLSSKVLAAPKRGAANLHFALLPQFRGLTPEMSCLLEGSAQSGATVHFIDEGVDTGDIIAQRAVDVAPDDDFRALQAKLYPLGRDMIADALQAFVKGPVEARPQDETQASKCRRPRGFNAILPDETPPDRVRNILRACMATRYTPYVPQEDGSRLYLLDAEWIDAGKSNDAPTAGIVLRIPCAGGELLVRRAWQRGREIGGN